MKTTILQVPMKKGVREKATKAAEKEGFSSLQEAVRVFLHKLADEEFHVSFSSPTFPLSPRNEQRYERWLKEIAAGKVKIKNFSDTTSLMNYLNED